MRQAYFYAPGDMGLPEPSAHDFGMAKKPKTAAPPPNQIAKWRTFRDLNQEELGALIDRSQETVGRYESGDLDPPTSILRLMAEKLRCTTEDLLHRQPGTADAIIETYSQLSPIGQKRALAVLKALKDSEDAA